jgi:type III restriction enzyme
MKGPALAFSELWARNSQGRCLFGYITKDRGGVGMAGQINALLNL